MFRTDAYPQISILIAARNEESNILRCLQSVAALNYPASKLEVLIGDDGSTDKTGTIVRDFVSHHPEFRYIFIDEHKLGLKGKTNVLAQLAQVSSGEYYFFCDADIAVNPEWLNSMLAGFAEKTGVVVGVTRMKKGGILSAFLSLEWMLTMLITRFFYFFNIPITALGNNMAVSRAAYQELGGYEKLGFSIVEDFALFMAIVKKGFAFSMLYDSGLLSFSEPLNSTQEWIAQRRRWMHGVMDSPLSTRLLLILAGLIVPLTLLLGIWLPVTAFWLLITNYMFVTVISGISIVILRQYDLWKALPFFWFYLMSSMTLMLVIYFSTGEVSWKGRDY